MNYLFGLCAQSTEHWNAFFPPPLDGVVGENECVLQYPTRSIVVRQCNVEYPQYELGLFAYKLQCMGETRGTKLHRHCAIQALRFRDLHGFLVSIFCMVVPVLLLFSFRAEFAFSVNKTTLFRFMFLSSSSFVFAFLAIPLFIFLALMNNSSFVGLIFLLISSAASVFSTINNQCSKG